MINIKNFNLTLLSIANIEYIMMESINNQNVDSKNTLSYF